MKLLLALVAFSAPLFAQCNFVVTPQQITLPASAAGVNSAVATVTTSNDCIWQPSVSASSASWLTAYVVTPGPSGSGVGPGKLGVSALQNPTNASRSGSVLVGNTTVIVTQSGAACTYVLTPGTINFPVGGGPGTEKVAANCIWTTGVSDKTWLIVPDNTQGTFDGTFTYTVGPNACVASRQGAIGVGFPGTQVSGQMVITQDGAPGNLTISPATASIGPDAADGKVAVSTGSTCTWSAFVDVSWLSITLGIPGTGSSSLSYHAAANPSSTRTGHIIIGPQTFTVTQQAVAGPPFQITKIVNSGSFLQDGVSPGEIVSLFGTNMGPATGVPLQLTSDGKSITKTLGGVQVMFDDVPAALVYASATQINAVVPYSLTGKFGTTVQVQYQGSSSNALSIGVQNAGPGIFTQDASGGGAGAILNQDSTVNTVANRAARGSVVQIFCTGGGATSPVSVDALLTPLVEPFPRLTQPVSVLIGGSVAQVVYSGAAPGGIAGFTQINVVVPDGIAPGASVPVVIGIAAWVSQPGVTLAVK